MHEDLPKHPKGTFAFLLVYVVLFVAGWMAIYTYLYLGRGGVGRMKTSLYERIWGWGVGVMLVFFFGTLANASIRHGFHPPSHVETIDPRKVFRAINSRNRVSRWMPVERSM